MFAWRMVSALKAISCDWLPTPLRRRNPGRTFGLSDRALPA